MVDKRKRDARARAAETGEPYTRANRIVSHGMDRDVRLLLDLLTMLPPMTEAARAKPNSWWHRYADAYPRQWEAGYFIGSLAPFAGRLLNGTADDEDVRRLAEYCLMFFDVADRPDCCELLDYVASNFDAASDGTIGRRWATSVCDVAWRLYVPRESRQLVADGRAAWPFPVA